MNSTSLYHVTLVMVCQIFFLIFCGIVCPAIGTILPIIFGSLLRVGFYLGREVAQNEAKLGTPPWWSGFQFWKWSLDSKLDLLFPIIVGMLSPTVCQLIV